MKESITVGIIVISVLLFAFGVAQLAKHYDVVPRTTTLIEVKKRPIQNALEEEPVHDLGPLVFLEAYSFYDADLKYKVVRLETGERIFIVHSSSGTSCIKIDKR